MNADDRDALLDEIARIIEVRPSPAFAARVRAGVADGSSPWRWASIAVATLAGAAAVVVLVVSMRHVRPQPADAAPLRAVDAMSRPVVGAAPPSTDQTIQRNVTSPNTSRQREHPTRASRPARRVDPAVRPLVPRGQLMALNRVLATVMAGGPLPITAPTARTADGQIEPLTRPDPIEIAPLVVQPLREPDRF